MAANSKERAPFNDEFEAAIEAAGHEISKGSGFMLIMINEEHGINCGGNMRRKGQVELLQLLLDKVQGELPADAAEVTIFRGASLDKH
jgi:hypothetical protein